MQYKCAGVQLLCVIGFGVKRGSKYYQQRTWLTEKEDQAIHVTSNVKALNLQRPFLFTLTIRAELFCQPAMKQFSPEEEARLLRSQSACTHSHNHTH